MNTLPLVISDPEIMSGSPVFRGTRVPVRTVFDYLARGAALAEFLDDFPTVSEELAVGVLQLAGDRLEDEALAAHPSQHISMA